MSLACQFTKNNVTTNFKSSLFYDVPVNSKTDHPQPRVYPGHLTGVLLPTAGNLTKAVKCGLSGLNTFIEMNKPP